MYKIYVCILFNLGEENGNPLQYSCLENPMDRRAWQSTVHGVAQSRTPLKQLSTHARISINSSVQGSESLAPCSTG